MVQACFCVCFSFVCLLLINWVNKYWNSVCYASFGTNICSLKLILSDLVLHPLAVWVESIQSVGIIMLGIIEVIQLVWDFQKYC